MSLSFIFNCLKEAAPNIMVRRTDKVFFTNGQSQRAIKRVIKQTLYPSHQNHSDFTLPWKEFRKKYHIEQNSGQGLKIDVLNFLREWDTEDLTDAEVEQEVKFVKHFFNLNDHYRAPLTRLIYNRHFSDEAQMINLVNEDSSLSKIQVVFPPEVLYDKFGVERMEIQDAKQEVRKKITVIANRIKDDLLTDLPYDQYLAENSKFLVYSQIPPSLPYLFARTLTMQNCIIIGQRRGQPVEHVFTECRDM
jgi:hypothetical protein